MITKSPEKSSNRKQHRR